MNSRLIKETARAWGVRQKELKRINRWLEDKVPPHERHRALTVLLRRLQNSNQPAKKDI